MELLRYMFAEGHWGDILWFVSGAWLLVLFIVIFFSRFFKKR